MMCVVICMCCVLVVTSYCKPLRSGFTDLCSIPRQGKIMNVPVFYYEVIMVLWALFNNAYTIIIIMYGMHEP